MELRPYQKAAVQAAANWLRYKDTPAILDISVAGGKTIIAKAIIEMFYYAGKRVCLLADREELLTQAGSKINVPFSYYGAAFNNIDDSAQIIVASIQSIYNKDLPPFDLIIVDECQLLSNEKEGAAWEFIKKNPNCKLLGLSGTPYRMSGELTWGDIVYSIKYSQLLALGFVAPITNKAVGNHDFTQLEITSLGDYAINDLENIMLEPEMLLASVNAIKKYFFNRKKNLIFCVSIKHCEILKTTLAANGIVAGVVTGKTDKKERKEILDNFRDGDLQHLITCELLLRGYDNPKIDMITCLRKTASLGLWNQLLGRLVRLHPDKKDGLLIDLSGNLQEHGGLGAEYRGKNKKELKKSHGKICPSCEEFVAPLSKECPDCGYIFPEPAPHEIKHNYEPDFSSETVFNPVTEYEVSGIRYCEHTSRTSGKVSLRVDYFCDTKYGKVSEWLSPHSDSNSAKNKAWQFFKKRGYEIYGDISEYSIDDLVFHAQKLKVPSHIEVKKEGKYDRIVDYKWHEPLDFPEVEPVDLGDEIPW